jgi:hypothetical protein
MDWLLRHGEKYLRPESRSSPFLMGYKKSEVYYEPLGVVAAIVSWNYRKGFDCPAAICPMTPFSVTQRLVSYSVCPVCWQRDRHQVLGACRLVFGVVRRRYQRVFKGV